MDICTTKIFMAMDGNNGWKLSQLLTVIIGAVDFLRQNQLYFNQKVPDTTPQFGDTFDFIVIGAGTAGATMAARLSEVSQATVLLIEAGFHENLFMGIPIHSLYLQSDNWNINWKYQTKSSKKYCLGMKDNSCLWPAGKVVGGSSVLNFMIASRGGAEDYNRWAEMGNEGWAYQDVLKYFKKLETMDIPGLKTDITYHGTDGPVHINYSSFHTLLAKAFLEAGKELGYSQVDYNGKNKIGFSYLQTTTVNGTRMSSNRAYLKPARNRNNLYVTFESTVTKLLIDQITNRAFGVEFVKYDQTVRVFAKKEVILCAGAIKSPQLLMLSGIGPAKHLTDLGIHVIQDLPVGENLMDHLTFYGLTWIINASVSLQLLNLINLRNAHLTDFLIKRTGSLTTPGGVEALSFINTKQLGKHSGLPDRTIVCWSYNKRKCCSRSLIFNFKKSMRQEWNKYYGTMVMLLKTKSHGRITLLANNVNVKPEIIPNYFDNPDDLKTMIAGVRTAILLGQTKTMQTLDSQLLNINYIECNDYEYGSDAYWECVLRTMSSTFYHYSGTCKMGAKEDPTAVVDPKLKVIGIQGLRVVDASIIPEIISGHLNIPVYMIVEKAANMIKKKWGYL